MQTTLPSSSPVSKTTPSIAPVAETFFPLLDLPLNPYRYYTKLLLKLIIIASLFLSFTASCVFVIFNGYIAWTLGRPVIAPLSSNPLKAVGLPYQDIHFNSHNGGSVLSGWYIPDDSANPSKTVIFSHGYQGNREELWVPLYKLAKALHANGYNVLMFDYGYVSNNPTRLMTAGAVESEELLGAIDYIKSTGSTQIYIWGFSMGAGTALQAALYSTDIAGMILDSTFLLTPRTLEYTLGQQKIDFPIKPSVKLIEFLLPLLNGLGLKQIPYQEVKSAHYPMPIFFIHGAKDARAPYSISEQIYQNQQATVNSQYWLAPKRGHETILRRQPKEYLKRSLRFLKGLSH